MALILASGCIACAATTQSPPILVPHDSRPAVRIEVADADEAALLAQQLHLTVAGHDSEGRLLIRGASDAQLARLREVGYKPVTMPAEEVEHRIVRVARARSEELLLGTGVALLRREAKEWVIRGSLAQLTQVRRLGFRISTLVAEPRPREIEVMVPTRADVQRVYDLGVDVIQVSEVERGGLRIGATAFDGQIDAIRKLGYTVTPR